MSCQRIASSELPPLSQLLSFESGSQIVLQHTTIMISQVHSAQSGVLLFILFGAFLFRKFGLGTRCLALFAIFGPAHYAC
jgi:hypothetical protein